MGGILRKLKVGAGQLSGGNPTTMTTKVHQYKTEIQLIFVFNYGNREDLKEKGKENAKTKNKTEVGVLETSNLGRVR